jgi:hypothetical protein
VGYEVGAEECMYSVLKDNEELLLMISHTDVQQCRISSLSELGGQRVRTINALARRLEKHNSKSPEEFLQLIRRNNLKKKQSLRQLNQSPSKN